MTGDSRPLHAAILAADPRDDLEPLLFADWLEEQGRLSQAEFLRVQRKLIRLPLGDPEERELLTRRDELIQSVRTWYDFPEEWYGDKRMAGEELRYDYPNWLRQTVLRPDQYLLGFVSHAEIHYRNFLELVEPLTRFQPVVNLKLRLDTPYRRRGQPGVATAEEFERIAESPLLAHVTALACEHVHAAGLEPLMKSRHLVRLRDFRAFSQPHIGHPDLRAIEAILNAPAGFQLEVLDLCGIADPGGDEPGNPIANRAAGLIAESPRMRRLRHLRISPGLGPHGAMALRNSEHLRWLETLASDRGGGLPMGPTDQADREWLHALRAVRGPG